MKALRVFGGEHWRTRFVCLLKPRVGGFCASELVRNGCGAGRRRRAAGGDCWRAALRPCQQACCIHVQQERSAHAATNAAPLRHQPADSHPAAGCQAARTSPSCSAVSAAMRGDAFSSPLSVCTRQRVRAFAAVVKSTELACQPGLVRGSVVRQVDAANAACISARAGIQRPGAWSLVRTAACCTLAASCAAVSHAIRAGTAKQVLTAHCLITRAAAVESVRRTLGARATRKWCFFTQS
jgi:hypothetical protein